MRVKENISWASGAGGTGGFLGPGNHLSPPCYLLLQACLQAPAQTQWGGKCLCSSEAHLSQDRVFEDVAKLGNAQGAKREGRERAAPLCSDARRAEVISVSRAL